MSYKKCMGICEWKKSIYFMDTYTHRFVKQNNFRIISSHISSLLSFIWSDIKEQFIQNHIVEVVVLLNIKKRFFKNTISLGIVKFKVLMSGQFCTVFFLSYWRGNDAHAKIHISQIQIILHTSLHNCFLKLFKCLL